MCVSVCTEQRCCHTVSVPRASVHLHFNRRLKEGALPAPRCSGPGLGREGPQDALRGAASAPATILCAPASAPAAILCMVAVLGAAGGTRFPGCFPSFSFPGWDFEMFLLSWVTLLHLSTFTGCSLTYFTLGNGNKRVQRSICDK